MATLAEVRRLYAQLMAAASGSTDPRLERIFELVPREAFLPAGPWHIRHNGRNVETPGADPAFLYQNTMVVLDAEKGINNGEPFLHAAWIGKAAPRAGDTVTHIGAGTGYYTAILAMLVLPKGRVHGFELEKHLAARARLNLEPFENAGVTAADAVTRKLPRSDLIYVNAGVVAPPVQWLAALKPGGRMVFPWRPAEKIGFAVLATNTTAGFSCEPFMPSWFIPCVGASAVGDNDRRPSPSQARRTRSIHITAECPPDDTATAIFGDVWFSSAALPAAGR
ncbi:MAG: SAM-dependent methyltransferase [Mesorhizobium sp.]